MAKKLYDMKVKAGTYEKDGETKNNYVSIGSVFEGNYGPYAIMSRHITLAGFANPEDRDSVIVSLFKPNDDRTNADKFADAVHSINDSEVPF